ncbi:MAG: hypothetical protein WC712_07710 [Candidatus Brocadiia bacterium]
MRDSERRRLNTKTTSKSFLPRNTPDTRKESLCEAKEEDRRSAEHFTTEDTEVHRGREALFEARKHEKTRGRGLTAEGAEVRRGREAFCEAKEEEINHETHERHDRFGGEARSTSQIHERKAFVRPKNRRRREEKSLTAEGAEVRRGREAFCEARKHEKTSGRGFTTEVRAQHPLEG